MKSMENRNQVKNDRATSEMFITSLSIIIMLYFYVVGRNGLKESTHSCTQQLRSLQLGSAGAQGCGLAQFFV